MPRPTKLRNRMLTIFRSILDDEMNVLMCTDWDLCYLLNKQLKPNDRISYRTFQRYKRDAMAVGFRNDDDDDNHCWDIIDPVYHQLFELFAEALINQKKALGHKILNDEKNWRRYQWLLERKFIEWNIRWSTLETEREQRFFKEEDIEQEKIDQEIYKGNILPYGSTPPYNDYTPPKPRIGPREYFRDENGKIRPVEDEDRQETLDGQ